MNSSTEQPKLKDEQTSISLRAERDQYVLVCCGCWREKHLADHALLWPFLVTIKKAFLTYVKWLLSWYVQREAQRRQHRIATAPSKPLQEPFEASRLPLLETLAHVLLHLFTRGSSDRTRPHEDISNE